MTKYTVEPSDNVIAYGKIGKITKIRSILCMENQNITLTITKHAMVSFFIYTNIYLSLQLLLCYHLFSLKLFMMYEQSKYIEDYINTTSNHNGEIV